MQIVPGVKVLSFVPGRIRLRVDLLKGAKDLARSVEQRLAQVPGILRVEVNPVSASLLVGYDRRRLAEADAIEALGEALRELFPQLDLSRLQKDMLGD